MRCLCLFLKWQLDVWDWGTRAWQVEPTCDQAVAREDTVPFPQQEPRGAVPCGLASV